MQLAFAWPSWMESKHWAEMLPRLAYVLTKEHRWDDLRRLIPLAKESRLRYALHTQLAVGLMQVNRIIEAFEVLDDLNQEQTMIFLADSSEVFEQIEPGLSLRVLQDATKVAGWMRREWLRIHKLLTMSE